MITFSKASTYASGAAALTHTFSHESTGYYRGLVVNLHDQNLNWNGVYPSSVKANGVEMTVSVSDTSFGDVRQYYLPNPTLGTYNIEVTFASISWLMAFAYSYTGVHQSGMLHTTAYGENTNANVAISVTTTIANCWAVTAGYDTAEETITGSTYYVLRASAGKINHRGGDSNGSVPNGTFTVDVTSATTTGNVSGLITVIAPATLIALLSTSAVTAIALTSAQANGESLYDGDATISERGFVYSTTPTPTTANFKKIAGGTIGAYSASLSGLSVNTTYYVRSYAINANGTGYGNEVSFTTLNIGQYELQKEIGAETGQTILGRINVTGTVGTITIKLGTAGTSTVIAAGAGNALFSGTYSGTSGLIITRSATFNGTIDNVFYVFSTLTATINWDLDALTVITAINSSVFFKRIEDDVFNSFRFYRYLDLLFKDLDGFVTVTVRDEREDITTEREKIFSVGNTSTGTVSPFQKKRVSFLIKNQAVIIGLKNASLNETFSIAQFLLTGHKRPKKMTSPSKVQSLS